MVLRGIDAAEFTQLIRRHAGLIHKIAYAYCRDAADREDVVQEIQRAVERARLAEYRATKWAVLGGVVIWLPAALLLFEAVTGVPAIGLVDPAWLVANLALGAAVLALGLALSRRYVERPGLGPRARRIVDALSGRSLRAATRHLADLSRFERDEPAA